MSHRSLCLLCSIILLTGSGVLHAQTSAVQTTQFDADPAHLWNRLYAALFLRVDASKTIHRADAGDLLFWSETTHLRSEPSRGTALRLLDEFIAGQAESPPPAPVWRALLQSELWAAHDWVGQKDEVLRARLGAAIGRIALSRNEIEALPDNYAATVGAKGFPGLPDSAHPEAPFLPPDLLTVGGPWICLGNDEKRPLASQHVDGAEGRSAFFAFLRLPAGREAALAYLEQIRTATSPLVPNPNPGTTPPSRLDRSVMPNPSLPQLAPGTMVALVRRMVLIDDEKQLVVSHLTQSVALRVYREIVHDVSELGAQHAQEFHAFVLDQPALPMGRVPTLRSRRADEPDFGFGPQLAHYGHDPFDAPERVSAFAKGTVTCVMCHRLPGVFSVNSIANLFSRLSLKPLRSLRDSTIEAEQEKARLVKLDFAKSDLFFARQESRIRQSLYEPAP